MPQNEKIISVYIGDISKNQLSHDYINHQVIHLDGKDIIQYNGSEQTYLNDLGEISILHQHESTNSLTYIHLCDSKSSILKQAYEFIKTVQIKAVTHLIFLHSSFRQKRYNLQESKCPVVILNGNSTTNILCEETRNLVNQIKNQITCLFNDENLIDPVNTTSRFWCFSFSTLQLQEEQTIMDKLSEITIPKQVDIKAFIMISYKDSMSILSKIVEPLETKLSIIKDQCIFANWNENQVEPIIVVIALNCLLQE